MKLELLGLNAYEARVLETLARLGKTSASKISIGSEVPYGRIYDVLNTLVSKRFVKLLPGPTKQYAAADPKLLLHKLEERKKELIELEGDIVKLKEEYKSAGEEPVWVIHGKRNFYKAIDKMPWPKKYDYAIRYTVEPNPVWMGNLRRLISKGIKVRALVRNVPETEDAIGKRLFPRWKCANLMMTTGLLWK